MKKVVVIISIFLFGCGGPTTEVRTDSAVVYIDTAIPELNKSIIDTALSCYPPNGTNKILFQADTNAIHPAWIENYKGGGYLGSGSSFEAIKIITNEQGTFLYGDFYSTRGGKLNIKENGYTGPVYVYFNDWSCTESPLVLPGCPSNFKEISMDNITGTARKYMADDGKYFYEIKIKINSSEATSKFLNKIIVIKSINGLFTDTVSSTINEPSGIVTFSGCNEKDIFEIKGSYSCQAGYGPFPTLFFRDFKIIQ